jgi:hypothetical protein
VQNQSELEQALDLLAVWQRSSLMDLEYLVDQVLSAQLVQYRQSLLGTAVAEGIRERLGAGSILATATVSAIGGVEFEGTGSIECFATVTANPVAIYGAVATVNGITLVNCLGRVLGDNWTDETAGTEAWTGISASTTTWTVETAGSETWTGTTPTVTTWSNISSGNSQWQ